nr:unnamed protein product [Callosobruchus chinensis]
MEALLGGGTKFSIQTRKMAIRTILIITVVNACLVYGVKRCCNEKNNVLAQDLQKCLDGSALDINPSCTVLPVHANITRIRVDSEDILYFDEDPIPPDEYCFAMNQNTTRELYLLCKENDDDDDERSIDILKNVCETISVLFMILTVVIYISLPQMMDLQGQAIVHSISGKALAYVTLITLYVAPYLEDVPCHIGAYLLYISFLYAFFWLNILCFQIWRQIVNPRLFNCIKNWKLVYYVYGIGGSLLCWVILALIQHSHFENIEHLHPGIAESFYLSSIQTVELTRLKLYIKLFFIMGITWLFEVISSAAENYRSLKWLWHVTDIINSLEGLTIFLILVVFRRKVMKHLANKSFCKCLKLPSAWKDLEDSECEAMEYEVSMTSDTDKI